MMKNKDLESEGPSSIKKNRRDLENATRNDIGDTSRISAISEDGLTGRHLLGLKGNQFTDRSAKDLNPI